jgi:regulator of protease activity HflC (stomatin/prohibitin superfamily)
LSAYKDAQEAKAEKDKAINAAEGEAAKILSDAAGRSYQSLVDAKSITGSQFKEKSQDQTNLIGQYIIARKEGDASKAKATALLEEIDSVLVSSRTGGEASRLIREAGGFRTRVTQEARARVNDFKKKIEGFEKFPRLTLDRLWADTRDKILGAPLAEKFYLPPGRQKFILELSRDPAVAKQIRAKLLKKKKKDKAGESGTRK